jgi:hypothetical protein
MNGKPDLKITQTEEPAGRWCSSGHFPPETFVVDGYSGPMRFFEIVGSGVNGIFCELCFSIANKFSKKKAGK